MGDLLSNAVGVMQGGFNSLLGPATLKMGLDLLTLETRQGSKRAENIFYGQGSCKWIYTQLYLH